jgi:hypothetical protein
MSDRSTVIAAVLLFTFFVFITTKGELLDYLGTVGLGPKAGDWKGSSGSNNSGGDSGFNPLHFLSNNKNTIHSVLSIFTG